MLTSAVYCMFHLIQTADDARMMPKLKKRPSQLRYSTHTTAKQHCYRDPLSRTGNPVKCCLFISALILNVLLKFRMDKKKGQAGIEPFGNCQDKHLSEAHLAVQ